MPSLARSVPQPLKVPSLARSVSKPLKVPSLARSMPKPLKVPCLARYVPKPLSLWMKWWWNDEMMMMMMMKWWWWWNDDDDESKFWVFDPDETFIWYRGCFNLNFHMGKNVQKNFLMGLKIWWSWGSGKKFSKSRQVRWFFDFHPKLWRKKISAQVGAHFEWKFQYFGLECLVLHVLCQTSKSA